MASQLSNQSLKEVFKYFTELDGNKVDFKSVNKKVRKSANYAEYDLWFKEFDKIDEEFYEVNIDKCFAKNGKLYSLNYNRIPKDIKNLLKLLHKYPGGDLSNNVTYNSMMEKYNTWKNKRSHKEIVLSKYKDYLIEQRNNLKKKSKIPNEITEHPQYVYLIEELNERLAENTLTPEVINKFIKVFRNDLVSDYLEQDVDKALNEIKNKYLNLIHYEDNNDYMRASADAYLNVDEYFDDNELVDMSNIQENNNNLSETQPIDNPDDYQNSADYFGDFDDFKDIDPKQIYEVGFDKQHGIIRANLMQDRYNRLIQVRDLIGELLNTPYTDFVYRYYFTGIGWKTIKLHGHEALRSLIDVIEGYGLYNRSEMTQTAISDFYNKDTIPDPEFVDALWIGPEVNNKVKDGQPEKATVGGEFYPYALMPARYCYQKILEKYQITTSLCKVDDKGKTTYKDMFDMNCFCYTLAQAKIPTNILDEIKMHCLGRYQKSSKLNDICKIVDLCVRITYLRKDNNVERIKDIGVAFDNHKYFVHMAILREPGMLGDHYFLYETLNITKFYLNHEQDMINWAIDHGKDIESMWNKSRYNKNKDCYEVKDNKQAKITSLDLIVYLRDHDFLRKYTMNETLILPTNLYTCMKDDIVNLDYQESSLREIRDKVSKKKDKSKPISKFYYADFEASTQGFHKPYCVSYSSRNSKKIHTIYGYDCAWELLNQLEDNSLTYFHNLAYDGRFLAKYGIKQCIKKGGKLLSFKITFKGKNLQFRDSWAMISSKLSDFPSMFNIKDVEKELYPYNYYTEERVKSNIGLISEAGKYEIVPWTDEQYKIFNDNIDKIGCRMDQDKLYCHDGEYFDMEMYCQFYCEQDVNILKIGHTMFRDLVMEELDLDIDKSISISSLANKYFELNVYSKIPDLYEYSGVIREYIQGCVKGGRCMTRQNKKWHCTEKLYDYDACSLYPSAVHRLKLATGKPNVVPEEWCGDSKFLLDHSMDEQQLLPSGEKFISAFIVDIEITKVGKELAFPIIMHKTKEGNKNVNECCSMRVDNYELEDLIKFQQIKFTIKRGYYWTGVKSDLFSNEMKRIYDLRVQYKKQKNPLQLVLKLLMNSTYGKTIQKPIKSELVYKQVEKTKNGVIYNDAARFNKKNAALIKEYYHVSDNIMCFDVDKSFDDFFVPNLIGVQILSMSKRIMNEVMCLAEDLGIMIYYQDTDSMHIPVKDVPRLEDEYYKKYNRVLRGSDMGQFHPDFESDKIKGDLKSVESYFLGKKAYCDKLMNDNSEIDFHLRLKGIPNNLLESEYEDPLELYKYMYNGGEYKFNLLKLKPSFEMTKDMKIRSRTEFTRKIKF